IVSIIDVFEENSTAYYVMKYAQNGSLDDKVKREGHLSEAEATRYILKVAKALRFVHQHKMTHLDVKPANILLSDNDEPWLIDFGLSKQYDTKTGEQTSSTPLGYSPGYAPIEQYMAGGAGTFSPESDIYSLGATFYKLLTGVTPPDASSVANEGLPIQALKDKGVSQQTIYVIFQAMEHLRKDRLHDMGSFIRLLSEEQAQTKPQSEEETEVSTKMDTEDAQHSPEQERTNKTENKRVINLDIVIATLMVCVAIVSLLKNTIQTSPNEEVEYTKDSIVADEPRAKEAKRIVVNDISFKMIPVEGGTFTMGATSEMTEPFDDEKPTHQVTLSSYYIGETEVTQALWKAVMGSNPSNFKGDDLPVEQVSWDDCQTFIIKLNALTGKRFRLPTEAEWEFAARGGNKSCGYQYSGGDELSEVAWFVGNSGDRTHAVGTKTANELSIYDMSGNVCEWCSDNYVDYSSDSQVNPSSSGSGANRSFRGGSWINRNRKCRVSNRFSVDLNNRYDGLGLRLALSK
ncbi:MAG: bifunctional serine/threonine-protein kinase/formylglycine-generating enzyme family protein, partial [Bacteroidales bacterium]|nr:bifunctional serine/threonine-protein kinase/formylglycine-generating enzyme family protein [Bacteroidales bacterium]MDY2705029.1 bifunctional serine/threonine-protein kinase/formylglycine-generating enzyme family protein [Alloprevotella sp.]